MIYKREIIDLIPRQEQSTITQVIKDFTGTAIFLGRGNPDICEQLFHAS